MKLLQFITSILIFCLPFFSFSQDELTGLWVGYNTQEGTGVYNEQYDFEMYLHQDGMKISGRSYSYNGKISAQFVLEGTWNGVEFNFQEVKIINYKAEAGMEWCIKKGKLYLTTENGRKVLKGDWSGNTSFSECIPGKIVLRKKLQRA